MWHLRQLKKILKNTKGAFLTSLREWHIHNTPSFAFLHQIITCHLIISAFQLLQGFPFILERFQVLDLKQHKEQHQAWECNQDHRNRKESVSTETFRKETATLHSFQYPLWDLESRFAGKMSYMWIYQMMSQKSSGQEFSKPQFYQCSYASKTRSWAECCQAQEKLGMLICSFCQPANWIHVWDGGGFSQILLSPKYRGPQILLAREQLWTKNILPESQAFLILSTSIWTF